MQRTCNMRVTCLWCLRNGFWRFKCPSTITALQTNFLSIGLKRLTFVSLAVEFKLFKAQGATLLWTAGRLTSKDDKTRITRSSVCAAFLLYKLVTSSTPDTPKALHNHAGMPGPRLRHVRTHQRYVRDLCASVRHSLRYSYAKSTSTTRSVQH